MIEAAAGLLIGAVVGALLPGNALALAPHRVALLCLLLAVALAALLRKASSVFAVAKEFLLLAALSVGVLALQWATGVNLREPLYVVLLALLFFGAARAARGSGAP